MELTLELWRLTLEPWRLTLALWKHTMEPCSLGGFPASIHSSQNPWVDIFLVFTYANNARF
jgi:hypothetical protein